MLVGGSLRSRKATFWRTFRISTMFQLVALITLVTLLLGRPLYNSIMQELMQPVYARKLRVDLKHSLGVRQKKTGILKFDQQAIALEVLQRWENPMSLYTPEELSAIQAVEEAAAAAQAAKNTQTNTAQGGEAKQKEEGRAGAEAAAATQKAPAEAADVAKPAADAKNAEKTEENKREKDQEAVQAS